MLLLPTLLPLFFLPAPSLGCESCNGPQDRDIVMTRHVRRMQPDAVPATSKPRGPLKWGQLNFLHTTDTHGWLEGHILEQNYGADWGDFTSFTKRMKQKARDYDVDLLLLDTGTPHDALKLIRPLSKYHNSVRVPADHLLACLSGDLHDGAGLSDATSPNGKISNPIFENIDYDVLTIGNHELYVSDIAYETFKQFSKVYGDRYLTSNVEIMNKKTGKFEYIGKKFRHFTTDKGVRIMAFGVLYDFTGNSNASRITFATDLVKQKWFKNAVMTKDIDLFLLLGHNPARLNSDGSTFGTIYDAIRGMRPNKPIQIFGGHTHIRDFSVYDEMTTALESGRYCETLGWLSMKGLPVGASTDKIPGDVPQPTQSAVPPASSSAASNLVKKDSVAKEASKLLYSRRYLDWNRRTFEFHAKESQSDTFSTYKGLNVTQDILEARKKLKLRKLYGCAPKTWCLSCKPFGDPKSIFTLLSKALSTTVVNKKRADIARIIIINTGSVRFDLYKGPFTFDDSFIVSPFTDTFQYLPKVPYKQAKKILKILNNGAFEKRSAEKTQTLGTRDFGFSPQTPSLDDACLNPPIAHKHIGARAVSSEPRGRIIRRTSTELVPGYTTVDDFGKNGDDTIHSPIPFFDVPNDLQANASFPTDGTDPDSVDVIFLDFIAGDVIDALNKKGMSYSESDVKQYLPTTFTTNSYLPAYAKQAPAWQKNVPNCPVNDTEV